MSRLFLQWQIDKLSDSGIDICIEELESDLRKFKYEVEVREGELVKLREEKEKRKNALTK
jgi:hypothetical protein